VAVVPAALAVSIAGRAVGTRDPVR